METDDDLRARVQALVETLDDQYFVSKATGAELDRIAGIAGLKRHDIGENTVEESTNRVRLTRTPKAPW
jgi:hypothetical protein